MRPVFIYSLPYVLSYDIIINDIFVLSQYIPKYAVLFREAIVASGAVGMEMGIDR